MIKNTTQDKIDNLKNIKTKEDIKSLEVVNEFEDDHLPCFEVEINGFQYEFLWISPEVSSSFYYYDESKKAFKNLVELFEYQIEMLEGELED